MSSEPQVQPVILPMRLNRQEVHLGQFSYTAVARMKPRWR